MAKVLRFLDETLEFPLEDEGVLLVRKAGEYLYRLTD